MIMILKEKIHIFLYIDILRKKHVISLTKALILQLNKTNENK